MRTLLLASAVLFASVLAANATTFVAPSKPAAHAAGAIRFAGGKPVTGCSDIASQNFCSQYRGTPEFDDCITTYKHMHHC